MSFCQDNRGIQGFFKNVIASITLPNILRNRVDVEVIYDVELQLGTYFGISFGVYNQEFGFPSNSLQSAQVLVDGDPTQAQDLRFANLDVSGLIAEARVCLNEGVGPSILSHTFSFQVNDAICLHSSGRQAIPASWFTSITQTNTENVQISYSLFVGNGGFSEDVNLQQNLEPESNNVNQVVADDFKTIFVRYSKDDIGFGGEEPSNVFLFLPENVFDADDVENCVEFSTSNLFTIILISIPVVACSCLIGIAIAQRYMDNRDARRRRERRLARQNNIDNYRFFPGNPDIVLRPGEAQRNQDNNVVQAYAEEDDIVDGVNTTTINVHMETQRN